MIGGGLATLVTRWLRPWVLADCGSLMQLISSNTYNWAYPAAVKTPLDIPRSWCGSALKWKGLFDSETFVRTASAECLFLMSAGDIYQDVKFGRFQGGKSYGGYGGGSGSVVAQPMFPLHGTVWVWPILDGNQQRQRDRASLILVWPQQSTSQ